MCGGTAPYCQFGTPHISETIRARKLKLYSHLDRIKCTFREWFFFREGASQGCSAPSINLGPLISRFLFVDYFASNYFYVFILAFLATFVKVKRRSKVCQGQPLCHSALRCCLVNVYFIKKIWPSLSLISKICCPCLGFPALAFSQKTTFTFLKKCKYVIQMRRKHSHSLWQIYSE